MMATGQLPSQREVLRSIALTAREMGGLRSNIVRLLSDGGTGIDVNASAGQKVSDNVWELERILPGGGTVELAKELTNEIGNALPLDRCYLRVIQGDPQPPEPGTRASDGPINVAVKEYAALVILRIDTAGHLGRSWTGQMVHTVADGKKTTADVTFWIT